MFKFVRTRPLLALIALAAFVWPSALNAATSSISISANGANGAGVAVAPTGSCTAGAEGTWVYDYSATVGSGGFSSEATTLGLHLDLHSEGPGSPPAGGAWLDPGQSYSLLQNARGSLTLDLSSGSCGTNTLVFDGATASGAGTWSAADGTGSFRQAVGSGTFDLVAVVSSGTTNPFSLGLNGQVTVLDPNLAIEVASAMWDPATPQSEFRNATVQYRLVNVGPGDSYGVEFVADSTSPGVAPVGSLPGSLGNVMAGDDVLFEVRYQIEKGRCALVERGCGFDASFTVEMPDALDHPGERSTTVRVDLPTPSRR